MDRQRNIAECLLDPWFFGKTDSVFAGDRASVGQHPAKQNVQSRMGAFPVFRKIIVLDHDVRVDVAITGVAKTGNDQAGLCCRILAKRTSSTSCDRGTTMSSLSLVNPVSRSE